MPYNEKLAARIRQALAHLPAVEEKKMFGSLAFMVNGKMCVAAGADQIMCRIYPALHDEAIATAGCVTVVMGGREYKGYVYVSDQQLKTKTALEHWITLALDFNKKAIASGKSRR